MRPVVALAILCFAGGLGLRAQAVQGSASNETCAGCHDQAKKVAVSAHGSVACATCHEKHEEYPHPAGIAKPVCASCHQEAGNDYARGVHGRAVAAGNQSAPECSTCHQSAHDVLSPHSADFRKAVPDLCGMCHDAVLTEYKTSIHGQAIGRGELTAAVCTDCHGEHMILKKGDANSSVNGSHVRETCGQCHANVRLARRFGLPADRVTTFDASFHGLAVAGGSQTVANCASCHGFHGILPSSDVKATTNARNLPTTCGKCHPGAGSRFTIGPVHQSEGATEPPLVGWVRRFYLLVIPLTIGLMILHNGGDFIRKLLRHRRGVPFVRHAPQAGDLRMLPFERLSHAMLAVSFIVLAWTGVALKAHGEWWAAPLALPELRRNIHRAAAAVFMIVTAMHFISLLANRTLRHHWTEMIPQWRDATGAFQALLYNLGLREKKPDLPAHGYIEKAEYWAVVWGSAVMIVTGVLLWANNFSLRFLPKAILDVATAVHWYEAILASLAIVAWHLYFVIFDPEVYPMDFAWLTGRSTRKR